MRLWDINGVRGPVLSFDPESDASFVAWAARGAKLVAAGQAGSVRAWNGRTLEPEWISFQTALLDVTAFSASGRPLRSTPAALKEFVYLVERPGHGVATMTHDEFEKRRGRGKSSTQVIFMNVNKTIVPLVGAAMVILVPARALFPRMEPIRSRPTGRLRGCWKRGSQRRSSPRPCPRCRLHWSTTSRLSGPGASALRIGAGR